MVGDRWRERLGVKVTIDPGLCQGCGICEAHAPEVFTVTDEGVAVVVLPDVPPDLEAAVRLAVDDCPTESIQIVS